MGIQHKINQIRQKPEHIRVKYAWFCSIAITFFVVVVWIISSSAQNKKETNNSASGWMENLESQSGPLLDEAAKTRGSFYKMSQKAEELRKLEEEPQESEEISAEEEIDNEFLSE